MPQLQDEVFFGDGPGNPTTGVQELRFALWVVMIHDVISKIFLHFLFQALSLRTPRAVSHAARPPAQPRRAPSLQKPRGRDGGAWIQGGAWGNARQPRSGAFPRIEFEAHHPHNTATIPPRAAAKISTGLSPPRAAAAAGCSRDASPEPPRWHAQPWAPTSLLQTALGTSP